MVIVSIIKLDKDKGAEKYKNTVSDVNLCLICLLLFCGSRNEDYTMEK
jgi:hypothetical protein